MRQLFGALVGLLLVAAFAVSAGRGLALNAEPVATGDLDPASRTPGLGWLLAAGALLALLVLARRLSPVAPLVAGSVLLVATVAELIAPGALLPDGAAAPGAGFGMSLMTGYGLSALFGGLLLVIAAVPVGGRRRTPAPG